MAYIIERYNRFDTWDRKHQRYVFSVNGNWFAVKEVQLEWGKPQIPQSIEEDRSHDSWEIYDTFEDALKFVHLMKGLNAR